MKGKAASIFLFFCLVAPIVLTFGYLHYQKEQTRRKVEREIINSGDENGLVLLKFTEKESQTLLRWEHSREFEFDGQMYDIVKTEEKGDTTYYWCWWDEAETKLNQQLEELLVSSRNQQPSQHSQQEKLIDFFKSLYCIYPLTWGARTFQSVRIPYSYECRYRSITHPPPVPPPKALV
ncbi:MAG: hypothetical protein ACRBG0_02855 [Lewinella sp.]|uniref:hypothetical protein n=1 Tax=Lewinella sp. TaxID=2004506 RepID=UPI003D6B2184